MTTGKTIALTRQTCVGKVMSLLFNMLSRLVITFLPRRKLKDVRLIYQSQLLSVYEQWKLEFEIKNIISFTKWKMKNLGLDLTKCVQYLTRKIVKLWWKKSKNLYTENYFLFKFPTWSVDSIQFFFLFYFIFKLYNIVLVLPNIEMNPPRIYMCSPSWTLHPPPSPFHPSGSSQCTSPKHPVSCIEPGLATRFIHDIIHVSMPFSQFSLPSPSPRMHCFC